ncbi:MAG: cobalt ECF transporter T component CbiQ [Dehalococcoidia bacterium]
MVTAAFLDRYRDADSPLHRADARVKLVTAFGYILAISFTRSGDWGVLAMLALPLLGLAAASRLGVMSLVRRTFLALPFLAAAFPLLFTTPGAPILVVPVLGWDIAREGVTLLATIVARSWLAVGAGVLLVSTTPVAELLRASRALGVPAVLVSTLFFAYRYAFVIGDEAQRMLRARTSRSAALDGRRAGGSLRWRIGVAGSMVGSLFARSLERSDRIFAAMQARGYAGEILLLEPPREGATGILGGATLVTYGALVQLLARLA